MLFSAVACSPKSGKCFPKKCVAETEGTEYGASDMKKMKLIALVYGPQDEQLLSHWLAKYGHDVELLQISRHLNVPVQIAAAHFCDLNADNIDGLIIDDYTQYDPIVISQVHRMLMPHQVALFSARHDLAPVAGCVAASSIHNTVKLQGVPVPRALSTVA